MANLKTIRIKRLDNEVYVIASQPRTSTEICHIKDNRETTLEIHTDSSLNPGAYDLTFIGLNWGGPQQLNVDLVYDTVPPTITTITAPITPQVVGVFFTKTVHVTVA